MEGKYEVLTEQTRATEQQSLPTAPITSTIPRTDLLSMSTFGVFPDIISDKETMKEIIEEVGKGELCTPLKPADPSNRFTRDMLWWRNLYEKDPAKLEEKITDDEWKNRRKALLYGALVAANDYNTLKFLVETSESYSLAQKMLAEELERTKKTGGNIPEKKLFQ